MDSNNLGFWAESPIYNADYIFAEGLDNIGEMIQPNRSIGQEVSNAAAEPTHQIYGGSSSAVTPPLEVPNAAAESTNQIDGGNSPLTKRRRKSSRSKVWDMFDKVKDPATGKECNVCRNCKEKYVGSSKNGTSNLLKHMKKCPQRGNCSGDEPTETVDITTTSVLNQEKGIEDKPAEAGDVTTLVLNREHGLGDKHPELGDVTNPVLNRKNNDRDKPAEMGDVTNILNTEDDDGEKPLEMGGAIIPVLDREKNVFDDQEMKLTARMIIKHTYPQSMDGKDLSKYLRLTLKLKEDSSLQAEIFDIYNEAKKNLRGSLNKSLSGHFNLTINFLTRKLSVEYCCFTLQFIDDGWDLKKKVLGFKKIKPFFSIRESSRAFKNMLQDWSIGKNNVHSITTQNNSEVDLIVSYIVSQIKNQDHDSLSSSRKLLHINCFVDILNHLLKDGLQEVEDVFQRINSCILYIYVTPENEDNFQRAVDLVARTGKKVNSKDISPGLKSSFQTLGRVLGLKEAFFQLETLDWDFMTLNPGEEEWDKAALIYECLKLIDEAVRSPTLSRCLTTNMYFPEVCDINKKLYQWGKSGNSGVHEMACKMRKKFDTYWNNSSVVLAIAVVLDPRFKFDIVEGWYKEIYGGDAEIHCRQVREALREAYNEYAGGFKNPASSSACLVGDASSSTPHVTNNFDMLDSLGMSCTFPHDLDDGKWFKSELERYLEEPKFRPVKHFDILGWWRVNTPNFPTLAKMARDFLAIPVTAAQSNPSFHAGFMKVDRFINLDPEIIEALICTKDWSQSD